jgi:hypothetical protein
VPESSLVKAIRLVRKYMPPRISTLISKHKLSFCLEQLDSQYLERTVIVRLSHVNFNKILSSANGLERFIHRAITCHIRAIDSNEDR